MDRSVDSIGSCSLDVDADSSDVSDTSGSLNFTTPLSAKDITREFTAKITERCQLSQNTTTYLDPISGQIHTVVTPNEKTLISPGKKPSYLNLACCVNGYSNLTTYDSKVRQDINKSREVSPIRPSTNSIQHCKKNNSLAPPVIGSTNRTFKHGITIMSSRQHLNCDKESNSSFNIDVIDSQYLPQQSFIQQRVERLYGPGALAQGFYSPKKIKSKNVSTTAVKETESNPQTEFSRKFQELSSNRYLNQSNKNSYVYPSNTTTVDATDHCVNNTVDLPVLRHLSQEFRAQLPSISPKRSVAKTTHKTCVDIAYNNNEIAHDGLHKNVTQKEDIQETEEDVNSSSEASVVTTTSSSERCNEDNFNTKEKDGNYFLNVLKKEQSRVLEMAHRAEKYTCSLSNNTEIQEEVFGLLRSASGKARLLVSQKMKQFEGLCHNNLNRSPEDAFPTTTEDLQGFWDMMYLQVTHIESIFDEIEILKQNHWKLKTLDEAQTLLLQKQQSVSNHSKMRSSKIKKTSAQNGPLHQNGNSMEVMSAAALKREAQRKQLMEMKRKNKIAMNLDNSQLAIGTAIEIFVNENNS